MRGRALEDRRRGPSRRGRGRPGTDQPRVRVPGRPRRRGRHSRSGRGEGVPGHRGPAAHGAERRIVHRPRPRRRRPEALAAVPDHRRPGGPRAVGARRGVRAGHGDPEHVRVVIRVLASLPPHLGDHRPVLEADLVAHARTLDPDAVDKLGRRAVALLDPDGPRPREPKPTRNRFTLRPQGAGFEARGWLDTESAAGLRSALSPLTAPAAPEGAGQARDERSTAERNGDGLVELARRLLAVGNLGVENGQPVALTVTVPLETLTSGAGAGLLGFGAGGLSAAIAAQDALRLACDARVVPIVLASTGEPLFVGRESRLANRAQRRALSQRDGGCAFPGCQAPPQWCVAHHVRHWAHGGCTDLTNLVLLCPHHHRMIHIGDWAVEIDGGFPVFHPPPWVSGGPRRNPLHRPDLPVPRTPRHSAPVLLDAVLASS
ncbi:DUF222 domain-containing protein [Pseudonocardia alni]|uniref:HNH endonuclease signature motif containing protein n=1 Tax=Pseudonocardia alni TaxID=33907 RepID=UPI003317EFCD